MAHEDTFDKIADYISAELKTSLKDYEFITKLNKTTAASFKDYLVVAEKISKNVDRINENQNARARLESLVHAIDEIDLKVNSLESLAYKIENYSKRLEKTYKDLAPSVTRD